MTLGQKLYQRRLELGLSQSQVAGDQISRNMLSQLEHDQATPSVKTLLYLSKVLEVRISWLLEEDYREQEITALENARKLYHQGSFRSCMDCLMDMTVKSDESMLLLHRSARKYAETCWQEGKVQEAREALEIAQQQSGAYITSYDQICLQKQRFLCALTDHVQLDETAAAYRDVCQIHQKELESPLVWAEYHLQKGAYGEAEMMLDSADDPNNINVMYLRGLLLLRMGKQEEAIDYLERVEKIGALPKPRKKALFHVLEQYYLSRENYQLAYRYAVLRME